MTNGKISDGRVRGELYFSSFHCLLTEQEVVLLCCSLVIARGSSKGFIKRSPGLDEGRRTHFGGCDDCWTGDDNSVDASRCGQVGGEECKGAVGPVRVRATHIEK